MGSRHRRSATNPSLLCQFSSKWLKQGHDMVLESGCNVSGLGGDGDGDEQEVIVHV